MLYNYLLSVKNEFTFNLFLEEFDEPSSRVENSFDSEEEKRVEVSIIIQPLLIYLFVIRFIYFKQVLYFRLLIIYFVQEEDDEYDPDGRKKKRGKKRKAKSDSKKEKKRKKRKRGGDSAEVFVLIKSHLKFVNI